MDPDMSYGEEDSVSLASKRTEGNLNPHNDEGNSNPQGRLTSDGVVLKTRDRCLKIGTWNIRTVYQPGKLENLIQEWKAFI